MFKNFVITVRFTFSWKRSVYLEFV